MFCGQQRARRTGSGVSGKSCGLALRHLVIWGFKEVSGSPLCQGAEHESRYRCVPLSETEFRVAVGSPGVDSGPRVSGGGLSSELHRNPGWPSLPLSRRRPAGQPRVVLGVACSAPWAFEGPRCLGIALATSVWPSCPSLASWGCWWRLTNHVALTLSTAALLCLTVCSSPAPLPCDRDCGNIPVLFCVPTKNWVSLEENTGSRPSDLSRAVDEHPAGTANPLVLQTEREDTAVSRFRALGRSPPGAQPPD